jgi:hypothetical protein
MAFIHIFSNGKNVKFMKVEVVNKLLEHLFCVFLFTMCEQKYFPILINGKCTSHTEILIIFPLEKMWTVLKPMLDTSNLAWKWLTSWLPGPATELLTTTTKTTWHKCSCMEKHTVLPEMSAGIDEVKAYFFL